MTIPEEQRIKLESMQIKGIRWMIWNNIRREHIESRLLQIKEQSYTNDLEKFVNSQSRAVLIKLIESSPEINNEIIDTAYEKYRYGLKPGFTLFWAKGHQDNTVSKEFLEAHIKEYIADLKYDENAKYKNLEYVSLIQFDGIYELTLSYLQRFNYVDSDGEFTFIYMMKECFVWIGVDKNFVAINNMPDTLMTSLKRFFSKLYKTDITNVKITNNLLNRVFSEDNAKRVTRQSSNPPENQLEKIIIADANLSAKKNCIPAGYENYAVTNTQYTEEIDETTTGTLGVNCGKGKLYLSKSLTSTQFREWSIRRISDIIGFIKTSSSIKMETIAGFNMFSSSTWEGMKRSSVDYLNQIVLGIVTCKENENNIYTVSLDLHKIYQDLNKHFRCRVSYICGDCEERSVPSCSTCGNSELIIPSKGSGKIICNKCGTVQEGEYSLICENGHASTFDNINEIIELVSNDDFTEKIRKTISLYYPKYTLTSSEYIVISSSGIEIHESPDYEKLKPSDIVELAVVANRQLNNQEDKLTKILYSLKEKCDHPSIEECAKCKNKAWRNASEIECILQLFLGFEGFTPQPHQGHEFGDVSFLTNLRGKNMTLLGIAKSVPKSRTKRKITKSSDLGREVIQQALDAFNNARAEIVGIIYPYLIDDQLKYLLYHQAKLTNKRLVIMDYDFMLRLLDKFVCDNQLVL